MSGGNPDRGSRRRKILWAVLTIVIGGSGYVGSYLLYRGSHQEYWERTGRVYVIYPSGKSLIYTLHRPLMLMDSRMTGMDFHQGSHVPGPLPKTESPLVLRTCFLDQKGWEVVREKIYEPVNTPAGQFVASVEVLDEPRFTRLSTEQVLAIMGSDYEYSFLIIADDTTITTPEYPLLIVNLRRSRGREFRAVPSEIALLSANLGISNMDFEDFADSVDSEGIFRGF